MSQQYIYEPYTDTIICHHKKTRGYNTFPYHRHNGYEMYLFLSGNIKVYVDTNCYKPSSGDFILIPPSCMHRIISLDETEYERITVNVKQSMLEDLSTTKTDLSKCFSTENTTPIHLHEIEKEEFIRYAKQLEQTLQTDDYGADILCNINLSQLLLIANRQVQLSTSDHSNLMPTLIKDIMNYVHRNLQGELSLDTLSRQFYHSETYISRQFKLHTGLTLREYILDCKVEYAKKVLLRGQSVSEACYEAGFHDYANFIRSFTKIVGISPGKFAKRL